MLIITTNMPRNSHQQLLRNTQKKIYILRGGVKKSNTIKCCDAFCVTKFRTNASIWGEKGLVLKWNIYGGAIKTLDP